MGRGGLTDKGRFLNTLRQERDSVRLCLNRSLKESNMMQGAPELLVNVMSCVCTACAELRLQSA